MGMAPGFELIWGLGYSPAQRCVHRILKRLPKVSRNVYKVTETMLLSFRIPRNPFGGKF